MTIDYINTMLNDDRLENEDKIDCLNSFSKSVSDFVQNSVALDNNKLKELSEISLYIKKQKEVLLDV